MQCHQHLGKMQRILHKGPQNTYSPRFYYAKENSLYGWPQAVKFYLSGNLYRDTALYK